MLIKMNPTDAGMHYPDLRLDISKKLFANERDLINSLESDDLINFTARFVELGNERIPTLFELIAFKKLGEKFSISLVKAVDNK